ncbi:MAG: OB-fold nucleic acid binding domain-containing protein, partial [Bacteroidota bacterium]
MSVLDTEIQFFPGVGPKRAEAFGKVGVKTFRDLLYFYPRRYLDRSTVTPIRQLGDAPGGVTVVGTVTRTNMVFAGRKRFEVILEDGSGGRLKGVWFNRAGWIAKAFKQGDRIAMHGTPQQYGRQFSIVHPDFDKLDSDGPSLETGRIIPLYPGGSGLEKVGLNSRSIRRLVYRLIKEHGLEIPEVLPESMRTDHQLIDGRVALRAMHF